MWNQMAGALRRASDGGRPQVSDGVSLPEFGLLTGREAIAGTNQRASPGSRWTSLIQS